VKENYPFVTQAFSRHQIDTWLSEVSFRLVKQEFWQFFEGDYWTCGARLPRPVQVGKEQRHQISCMVFQKIA
jgi:hypothetical protein